MKMIRKLAVTAAAAGLFSASMVSHATVMDASTNNPLNFSWSYNTGSDLLTGSGSMTVSGFNSSLLTVNISLTNTAPLASERLTSFGFGIDPNATSVGFVDASDGGMINASLGANFPSIQTVEVCAFGGPNCSGGGNGGIAGAAGNDSFAVSLGGTWGNSVNIDPIAFKYQTAHGSYEFTVTTNVTEPAASLGLGLGLLGMGLILRRRRKSA